MERDYDYYDFQEINAEIGALESESVWDDDAAEAQAAWESD